MAIVYIVIPYLCRKWVYQKHNHLSLIACTYLTACYADVIQQYWPGTKPAASQFFSEGGGGRNGTFWGRKEQIWGTAAYVITCIAKWWMVFSLAFYWHWHYPPPAPLNLRPNGAIQILYITIIIIILIGGTPAANKFGEQLSPNPLPLTG